jgi:hypothetical protein
MTDDGTEVLVRETFRSREHVMTGRQVDLLAGVDQRQPARKWLLIAAAAVVLAAMVAVVGVAVGWPGRDDRVAAPDRDGPPAAPQGWVWHSSLGMEIAVPARWTVNDTACGQTNRPTVVYGFQPGAECITPEPPTKRIAIISGNLDPRRSGSGGDQDYFYGELYGQDYYTAGVSTRDIILDGVAASLTEGPIADGRYAALLAVPSRQVYLTVRSTKPIEVATIVNTARLVDVDRLGCTVNRPQITAPDPVPPDLVPASADTVRVCWYSAWRHGGRLEGSGELAATDAAWLVSAVNSAPAGRNPDKKGCVDSRPVVPEMVWLFVDPAGHTTRVWATLFWCTGRGLDNGARVVAVSKRMARVICAPPYPNIRRCDGFFDGPISGGRRDRR